VRIEHGEVKPHPRTIAALIGALSARSGANDHEPAANGLVGKVGNDDARIQGYT